MSKEFIEWMDQVKSARFWRGILKESPVYCPGGRVPVQLVNFGGEETERWVSALFPEDFVHLNPGHGVTVIEDVNGNFGVALADYP